LKTFHGVLFTAAGQLWVYVESVAGESGVVMRLLNTAHIASSDYYGPGAVITMAHGEEIRVNDTFNELATRLRNPLDEGRLEVAFLTDVEE
jgi:hypothetical protein